MIRDIYGKEIRKNASLATVAARARERTEISRRNWLMLEDWADKDASKRARADAACDTFLALADISKHLNRLTKGS